MLTWWRRRKERQKQVIRDADNVVVLFGNGAYSEGVINPFGIERGGTQILSSTNPPHFNLTMDALDCAAV